MQSNKFECVLALFYPVLYSPCLTFFSNLRNYFLKYGTLIILVFPKRENSFIAPYNYPGYLLLLILYSYKKLDRNF